MADTRTRAIYEIRKSDAGGSAVVRQGINAVMNIKAYTPELHSCMYIYAHTHEKQAKLLVKAKVVSRPHVKPNSKSLKSYALKPTFSSHSIHQPVHQASQWEVQPLLFPNP